MHQRLVKIKLEILFERENNVDKKGVKRKNTNQNNT